MIQNLTVRKVR